MNFSHSRFEGKLYKLSFWRWGVTLDLGSHRWIWTIRLSSRSMEEFEWMEQFL